jgi:hypothetical protein
MKAITHSEMLLIKKLHQLGSNGCRSSALQTWGDSSI